MMMVTCAETWSSTSLSVWLQASSSLMLLLLLVSLMAGTGVTGVMIVGWKGLDSFNSVLCWSHGTRTFCVIGGPSLRGHSNPV